MTEPSFNYSPIKIKGINTDISPKQTSNDLTKKNNSNENVSAHLLESTPVPEESYNTNDLSGYTGAPLARLETLDEKDDREVVNKAYPGVDDGFFSDSGQAGHGDSDEIDGIPPKHNPPQWPKFPLIPGYGFDLENGVGSVGIGESIPDLNVYQHKKTLAQGMMDLALFSANANQLRYVVETFRNHPYFYPSMTLISISLILQVAVGIGLIWNATYNVKNERDLCRANKINNFTVIAIFLVTVINVFISAFGVAPAPS